ncbi:acyltransferase family protein [Marinactinospora thermotolerans]|uniref:acyltransferase family protein n=1 Tax=Marinactinospora thermotolerans TaxID=531310 RepID=UPI003D8E3A87
MPSSSPSTPLDHARTREGSPAPPPPKQRDALLDNAKFLLIGLVVIGHAISPLENSRSAEVLYFWIYLFHMPAFVLISGYLSKSFDASPRRLDKLLTTVAAPYLVFWFLYALQSLWVGRDIPGSPLQALWLTWFLAALFVWRLTVPLWYRVRHPVLISIAISCCAAVVDLGTVMALPRILSLLPFFVAGLFLEPRHFAFLQRTWVRVCAVVTVAASAVATYLFLQPELHPTWLFWSRSLTDRDIELFPLGLPIRLFLLVTAAVLTAALLALTPRRATWFTGLGALTMYAFLLHGFPIRFAQYFGLYDHLSGLSGLVVVGVAAVGLTLLCMTPWVRRATSWAVEPKVGLLILRPSKPRSPQGS